MTIEESIRARTRRPTTEERLHRALPDVPIDQLRRELDRLVGQGVLIRGKKGALAPVESLGLRRAVFCATGHAYSFATPEEGGPDWFIPPGQAGGAWQGDTVLVRPLERPGHRQSARVVRVLERRTQRITGRLEVEKKRPYLLPDDGRYPRLALEREALGRAAPGDKIAAQVLSFGVGDKPPRGRLLRRYGPDGLRQSSVLAALDEAQVRHSFPRPVQAQTEELTRAATFSPDGRWDLRGTCIVTIDGAHSKDFDDAVSLHPLPDGALELGVHIADVSHYVPEGSPLDREAFLRGTSVYYADQVIPMLPPDLSDDLCSLRPHQMRYCLSAILTLGADGQVRGARFGPSLIQSRARLTYDQVNAFLGGDAAAVPDPDVGDMLRRMAKLARRLEHLRLARGALELDVPEGEIVCNPAGDPVDVRLRPRGESERLIESFMLLANQAVARFLAQKAYPCVYRVHEKPDPDKLALFTALAARLGYPVPAGRGQPSTGALQRILRLARGRPEQPALSTLLTRALARARYAPDCLGHYALAMDEYLHFTSPIRRYPDLVVHRMLRRALRGQPPRPAWQEQCRQAAAQSSERELLCDRAARQIEKFYFADYLHGREGEAFDGTVSGVQAFGLFVQLPNTIEGLVRTELLPGGGYEYDEGALTLSSPTGGRYTLGTPLRVTLLRADPGSGQIDFAPAGLPPQPPAPKRGQERPKPSGQPRKARPRRTRKKKR